MATVSLEAVLAQARQLAPAEQARLIEELRHASATNAVLDTPADDDDLKEQRETWAYLQQALDGDRLSSRRQFGSAKGLISMADDFDAPLDDVREYVP